MDQPQLVKVIEIAFQHLKSFQKLRPFSGQTIRARFSSLLKANKFDCLPGQLSKGLDLGSLRAGGASWLMMVSENPDLTRRRGRWLTNKVMEIYVQEILAVQFLPNLPAESKWFVVSGVAIFPWVLVQADNLCQARIPEQIWSIVLRDAAVATELDGRLRKERVEI